MGRVVISMIANKTCFSKKLDVASINVWLQQEKIPSIHDITARGTYHLDGYDIKAFNQNLDGENERDVYGAF